jgi:hypothetical protein
MKTFREIAEMHYASEPTNEFDKQYRQNRINALEKLLTEQLRIHDVVGRSEQLVAFLKWVGDGYDFENNAEKIVKDYIDEGN